MPESRTAAKQPDPFVMNKYQVTETVIQFLEIKGYKCKKRDDSSMNVDVIATKGDSVVYIESKGNQAKAHRDKVFDSSQIRIHLAEQLEAIMRLMQDEKFPIIYVAANPDIPRLRKLLSRVEKGMNSLNIARMWVRPDREVTIDYPHKGDQVL